MLKGLLVLENGLVFEGLSIGAEGTSIGELVFNTSMSGYQEILTDPSYCQQVITLTSPHVGNVGINEQDLESEKVWCKGLVIRQLAKVASNWRSQETLQDFLLKQNIVALEQIDTRHLTHVLRGEGAQSVCITTALNYEEALYKAKSFNGLNNLDLGAVVSTPQTYKYSLDRQEWGQDNRAKASKHIVVYDFGVKRNILKLLVEAGAKLTVVNAKTPVSEVLAMKPDGVFLSNGPGDPRACDYAIKATKELLIKKVPLFGICLGFQILALALGAQTQKMKFGHHGANHPVIDLSNNKVFITSQNHGFMVNESSLSSEVTITHRSLFDDTIQGISVEAAFGFQGHPEASPGPHDLMFLFNKFMALINKAKKD